MSNEQEMKQEPVSITETIENDKELIEKCEETDDVAELKNKIKKLKAENDDLKNQLNMKSTLPLAEELSKVTSSIKDGTLSVVAQIEAGIKNSNLIPQTEFEFPEWVAPLNTPISRRRQTLGVLAFMSLQVASVLFTIYCVFNTWTWVFFIPYMFWFFFDQESSKNGIGRRIPWVRNFFIFKWFAQYFPITLHKTTELDPTKKYLFAYHPHGIIGIGAVCSFGTNACGVDELFPGLNIKPMTLKINFRFPFYREILLALGLADVGKSSINNTIGDRAPPGNACLIVVGGAAEALDAIPHTMDLTIKKRKGFVKMAIVNGVSLVPVIGFGENDLWDQIDNPRGSKLRDIQNNIMRTLGFSTPLLFGRGVFQYRYGIVPKRVPIHVVVGQPIEIKKNPNVTNEELDAYHQSYLNELQALYDQYKDTFHKNRVRDLQFVE